MTAGPDMVPQTIVALRLTGQSGWRIEAFEGAPARLDMGRRRSMLAGA